MTPFTALKNFSPFHFISLYIYLLLSKALTFKYKTKRFFLYVQHLKFSFLHALKVFETVDLQCQSFLTPALDGGEWSASGARCINRGGIVPGTHCTKDWVV